jgi:hypothetical protein
MRAEGLVRGRDCARDALSDPDHDLSCIAIGCPSHGRIG